MEWLKNLSNAIEYIESHLDTEISYEEVCADCVLFNLLFSAVIFLCCRNFIVRIHPQTQDVPSCF